MSLMMMHLKDPLPDLIQLRPQVPEDLIAVIEQALAKDLDDRFASAEEMSRTLKRVFDPLQAGAVLETQLSEANQDPGQVATVLEAAPSAPGKMPTEVERMSPDQNGVPVDQRIMAFVQVESPTLIEDSARSGEAVAAGPFSGSPGASVIERGPGGFDTTPEPPGRTFPMTLPGKPIHWIVGVAAVLAVVLGGIMVPNLIGGNEKDDPVVVAWESQTAQVFSASIGMDEPDASITAAPTITHNPTATETPLPTSVPTPTISPTATIPVGVPFSRINGISIDNQGNYIVNYETFEFTETLPGMHVHFFFNTVPQEEAGIPGDGPWYLWGGPRPFDGYRLSDRPQVATQMCILVANADHSVQLNSGNCVILPDVSVASTNLDLVCRSGPGLDYPEAINLSNGQVMPVIGISPDENWWQISIPDREGETYWLERDLTTFSGDITTLPLSEPPPIPTAKTVAITGIQLDAENYYVVDYTTQGFTEQLPGTHLHFFFNTVPSEEVGARGSSERIMHDGPAPFTRYSKSDRPDGATQMCVLVANPDYSVIQNSGNCFDLPQ
jgi:hypothetical protein